MKIQRLRSTKRQRSRQARVFILAAVVLALLLISGSALGSGDQSDLEAAYARLADLDHYRFVSRVDQTTVPLPTLANVGLSSVSHSALVEGKIEPQADRAELSISEQSGSMLDGLRHVEFRVDQGQVWGRAQGRDWEELEPGEGLDGTANNPAAFLQAARNATFAGIEERLGQEFRLISFDLDGVAYAEVMRAALQEEMSRRGELAPGELLERLTYYEEMTGFGTLWINQEGLPQRLILHAVYPPLPDEIEYQEVEVTTDFSDWQSGSAFSFLSGGAARVIPGTVEEARSTLFLALIVALFLSFPLALMRYRQSRGLYRLTVFLIIGLFLIEPQLSSTAVHAAATRRVDRISEAELNRAEDARIEAAVEEIEAEFRSRFGVHRGSTDADVAGLNSTVARAPQEGRVYAPVAQSVVDSDGDGIDDATETSRGLNFNNIDSDGDGIDDGTEDRLGLDPADPDTDGDQLSDGFEVAGIQMGGQTFYLDPLSPDTNGDEILDSIECMQAVDISTDAAGKKTKITAAGDGTCADSDGDGTPDFASDDNDGDGVWDWMDAQSDSRFGSLTEGVDNANFDFGVDHYTSNKPLRITFEVRPTNPDHLWYSMNVLDWPSGDYEGQIRRVHDTKLGTSGSAANGDMQLVPMIEVTLPAADASHLPTLPNKDVIVGKNEQLDEWLDMEVLQRYQMAVFWSQDNESLQVYLPATLIRDKHGNAPVNFAAKMLYWPKGDGLFTQDHRMRLVWLVQMDSDHCVVPEGSTYDESCQPTGDNYDGGKHWQTIKRKPVHRYYDDFHLTAFTAEQDLKATGQIFYEDPSQIASPEAYVADQLLGLGSVMEGYLRRNMTPEGALSAFQSGNAAMGNRLRASAVIRDPDFYGLLAAMGTRETPNLLDAQFAQHRQQVSFPTLLFVTQGESRVAGLEGMATGGGLRLDLSESGAHQHATSIRIGTFAYDSNPGSVAGKKNPNWKPADPGRVWLEDLREQSAAAYLQMAERSGAGSALKFSATDFQEMTLGLFWNLARGITLNTDLAQGSPAGVADAQDFTNNLRDVVDNAGQNVIGAMTTVLSDFRQVDRQLKASAVLIREPSAVNFGASLRANRVATGLRFGTIAMAGAFATLGLLVLAKDQLGLSDGAVRVLEATSSSINVVLSTVMIGVEIAKVVQSVQAASTSGLKALKSALTMSSTASKAGTVAAVVVVAVILVVSLVMMTKMFLDGNAIAAKTALAQGVATAIVVAVLFAIGLKFPVGTVIVLLVALVDGIITAICKIANAAGGKDAQGKTFEDRNKVFCGAIVNNIVNVLGGVFYGSVPMVDMNYKNRLDFGGTDTKVIESGGRVGMTAGNHLHVTQPLTVTVHLPDDHEFRQDSISLQDVIGVDGMFGPPMLFATYTRLIKEKNAFNYALVTNEAATEDSRLKRPTPQKWTVMAKGGKRNWALKPATPSIELELGSSINWHPDLYVREYYEYSLAECGLFNNGCDFLFRHFNKTQDGTQHISIGENLTYDVFPGTLTEFYALEQVQRNGQTTHEYRLAWGGALPFPPLQDADGDGLRAGLDPEDKSADLDGDGLSDTFELGDIRLDPQRADSDDDGLSDYDEIRWGTRPDRPDSDGDGLSDHEEIKGWELTYLDLNGTQKRTWVTSDPLLFDTDGDGYSDNEERVLVLHPRARDVDVTVLSLETSTDQRDSLYLAPSQTLAFTSTVRNELLKPTAYGLLEAEILGASEIDPVPFDLGPQEAEQIHGSIDVPEGDNDEIVLRSRAGANIIDESATYANLLLGVAQEDQLKMMLGFNRPVAGQGPLIDDTGNVTLTCGHSLCPTIVPGEDRHASFNAGSYYKAKGDSLNFNEPRFSLGGWVTPRRVPGDRASERVIFGAPPQEWLLPPNWGWARATPQQDYLQLSLVDLTTTTPAVKLHFKATDGTVCQQVLSDLKVLYGQRTHIFVTYDGNQVTGYHNGEWVNSYALQNCSEKTPAGNSATIGIGTGDSTVYLDEITVTKGGDGDGGKWDVYLQRHRTHGYDWFKESKSRDAQNVDKTFTFRNYERLNVCELDGNEEDIGMSTNCQSGDSKDEYLKTIPFLMLANGIPENGDDSKLFLGLFPSYAHEAALAPFIMPNKVTNHAFDAHGFGGSIKIGTYNNLFQGDLDDLRIYGSVLSDRDIYELASGAGLIYHLDEATGRREYRNAGHESIQLVCADSAGTNCPVSGLPGYVGQAVRFTESSDQALTLDGLQERFGAEPAIGLWVRPDAGSASAPLPLLRYGTEQAGFTLYATQQRDETLLSIAANGSEPEPSGVSVLSETWSHIGVGQEGNSVFLYVNGESKQTVTLESTQPTAVDDGADLRIGNGYSGQIDEVRIGSGAAYVTRAYESRALIHLPFDDLSGSTTFSNSTGQGDLICVKAEGCILQAGFHGRVRESVEFDGSATYASGRDEIPRLRQPAMSDESFSLSLWVNPINVSGSGSEATTIVARYPSSATGGTIDWSLNLAPENGQVAPSLEVALIDAAGEVTGTVIVESDGVPVPLNRWHHLGVTYDGTDGRNLLRLFVNGSKVSERQFTNRLHLDGEELHFGYNYVGRLDEFMYYNHALTSAEMLSLYDYQETWREATDTKRFQIDGRGPTLKVTTGNIVQPGTHVFGIVVSDAEAGIQSVEYQDADGDWKPAHTETATAGVWTFALDVQQTTTVKVRATDNVGNVSTDSHQVTVDSTAPVVTLEPAGSQTTLTATGRVTDQGSGVESIEVMIIDPSGQALSPPRATPLDDDGSWSVSQELPPDVNAAYQIWVEAEDQVGNSFKGVVGTLHVDNQGPMPTLSEDTPQPSPDGRTPATLAGINENQPILRGSVTDIVTSNVSGGSPSAVSQVEVGLLHRRDQNEPDKVLWNEATLEGSFELPTRSWLMPIPGNLEGVYDISLRATDALGNQRTVPGVWTGIIDTQSPEVQVLDWIGESSGGSEQGCLFIDFNLGDGSFDCNGETRTENSSTINYGESWSFFPLPKETDWYDELYIGSNPPSRIFSRHVDIDLPEGGTAESCDIYGNCKRCQVPDGRAASNCTDYSADPQSSRPSSLGILSSPISQEEQIPPILHATVSYDRPTAYAPGSEPAAPTIEQVVLDEPYVLIDDAVLAATRPFASEFSAAGTRIAWDPYPGATHYFAGWTTGEEALPDELTRYDGAGIHTEQLPDQGRYYAHVMAMDDEGEQHTYTLGPIYFDGAPPATYLNWEEFGPDQPYTLWEEALTPDGVRCNLLGIDDRMAFLSRNTSPRGGEQRLYGTWNDEWLALHWTNVDLDWMGDLHIYIDSVEGGGLYTHNPYRSIDEATALVTMPERLHVQSQPADRMQADFAFLVEDGINTLFLQWQESGWEVIDSEPVRFKVVDENVYIWLPLSLLGVDSADVDISLVGFVTEEESMEVWATMPGDNPLNSPEMLPIHPPRAIEVDHNLVNLQTAMRLSTNAEINNSLDNCPSHLHFDRALLDVTFLADPHGEVYDPVVHEGVHALVPDDLEPVLASLCEDVSNPAPDTVCKLYQHVVQGVGGDGIEVGPTGKRHASAGPGDEIVFHATLRNLSSQETGEIELVVEGDHYSGNGALAVGTLAPYESRVVEFSETISAASDEEVTEIRIMPVERIVDGETDTEIVYEFEPHTVLHVIDRAPPSAALLEDRFLGDLLGVGDHLLHGVVHDQSAVSEIVLTTSLGESHPCEDIIKRDAFTSAWTCSISIPEETADGTEVEVSISATDVYGHVSEELARWRFEVDNQAPSVSLLDADGTVHAATTVLVTDTLRLEGIAQDEHLLAAVRVCEEISGVRLCDSADLRHYTAVAESNDSVHWVVERPLEAELVVTTPLVITAVDAAGNETRLELTLEIDTRVPEVEEGPILVDLSYAPAEPIDGENAFYRLQSMATEGEDLCLSADRLEADAPLGGAAHMESCQEESLNQQWRFVHQLTEQDLYWMQPVALLADNLCLEGNQTGAEALALEGAAFLDACQFTEGQTWSPVKAADGYYTLQSTSADGETRCLQAARPDPEAFLGGAAYMDACAESPEQLWKLVPIVFESEGLDESQLIDDDEEETSTLTWQVREDLDSHGASVRGMYWVAQSNTLVSGAEDGTLQVWDIPLDQKSVRTADNVAGITALAADATNPRMALGTQSGLVWVTDQATDSVYRLEGEEGQVTSASWSPDGSLLATSSVDGTVHIWDWAAEDDRLIIAVEGGALSSVAWSPAGDVLATASEDGLVRLWDAQSGEALSSFEDHSGWVWSVAWSPDGSLLASASQDGTVRVWERETGESLFVLEAHEGWVWSVAWSPDGSSLATGGEDGAVHVWDTGTGDRVQVGEYGTEVTILSWSPDGMNIAAGLLDGTVEIVPAGTAVEAEPPVDSTAKPGLTWESVATLDGHESFVRQVDWSSDGAILASGSDDGTLQTWDVQSGEAAVSTPTGDAITSMAWSPEDALLAIGSNRGTVLVKDMMTESFTEFVASGGEITGLAWSWDSWYLATGDGDGLTTVWEWASESDLITLDSQGGSISSMEGSPDSALMAIGTQDGIVRILDADLGGFVASLKGHEGWVWSVAWSPDGSRLASSSEDGSVRIWDPESQETVLDLEGHNGGVRSVAWSADGRFVAAGGEDGGVRIWDVGTGELVLSENRDTVILSLAWSPDGEHFAIGLLDGTVEIGRIGDAGL